MENKTTIVVGLHPFTREQKVTVYEDNKILNEAYPILDNLVNVVNGFCSQYNIDKIYLCGSTDFAIKYKKDMNSKFSINVPIEIISE